MAVPHRATRSARGLRRYPRIAELEIRIFGLLAWIVLRLLRLTVRVERRGLAELEHRWADRQPVVFAFWHGRAIMMPFFYQGPGAAIMNSTHRDGRIITRALERFGFEATGGSSSRGAVAGTLGLFRAFRRGLDVALVADGPRGPAGVAKPGAAELAVRLRAPLFPVGASASKAVRLRGWDKMMIPLPGAHVAFVVGAPLWPDPHGDARAQREALRAELERRLRGACREADALVGQEPQDT